MKRRKTRVNPDLTKQVELKIYPTRMSGLGAQEISGDVFGWLPESCYFRQDGDSLIVNSANGSSRYRFDFEAGAYRRV